MITTTIIIIIIIILIREEKSALKHAFKSMMKSMKDKKWKNKALHGQYPKILEKPHVDTITTNKWPVSKDPREASCGHNHHQQMVVK